MKKAFFFVFACVAILTTGCGYSDHDRRESMAEVANKALNLTLDPTAARDWGGDIPQGDLTELESIKWLTPVMAGVDYSAGKAGATKDGNRYCVKQEASSTSGDITISFLRQRAGHAVDSLNWERVGYITNRYSGHFRQ